MSAEDNLSQGQFNITLHHHEGPLSHTINAYTDRGNKAGSMEWEKSFGNIEDIYVHPDARRQGIASSMWDLAHQVSKETRTPTPQHSSQRTLEGDEWAKSVGGQLPHNRMTTKEIKA